MKFGSMIRLPGLRPLARDHGILLVCAQHGYKAVDASVGDRLKLSAEMRAIYYLYISQNLEDEQWILSPMIADNGLRREFHERHRCIRALAAQLNEIEQTEDPGKWLLARLADVLTDYVYWAEHTLYPRIEDGIESEQLRQLSQWTSLIEAGRNRFANRLHSSIAMQQPSGLPI